MPLSSALTKAHINDEVAGRNGFTRKKSIETVEILLELIEHLAFFFITLSTVSVIIKPHQGVVPTHQKKEIQVPDLS